MVKTSKPTILHLTVDQLHRSDLNVRKKPSSAASDAEVSASLLSVGLIQPMVVIPREAGGYEVVAGDRRRRLLTALAEADPSRKGMTFPCMKVDDLSKVTEISMAENRAREAMSLPDVYKASPQGLCARQRFGGHNENTGYATSLKRAMGSLRVRNSPGESRFALCHR